MAVAFIFLFMNFIRLFLILLFFASFVAKAQTVAVPKHEYRAVWLTTIENLDWPKTVVRTPSDTIRQQRELCAILDSLKALNVNTVLLQTRVRGDVIYPSRLESFSHVLTGVEGRSPGYDPLAFAISECHKRGMQLHAWLVTMPLGKDEHIKRQGKLALSRRRKELCTRYKGAWYMEPGNPATDKYLVALVEEVVSNYNVDGIHLDYIRYPDRTNGYPDASLHKKYGKGLSLAAWRRSNVTRIAKAVYESVKAIKPWVRVSCAPLGKYDNLSRYSSLGWDARNAVFQEAQDWMRDGIMDILFPMLYFNGNNFYPFVLDWQENSHGRHVVPGIGVYRLLPEYGGWPAIEIERQLRTSRSAGTSGTAMFRTAHLLDTSGEAGRLYGRVYEYPALVPPMDWACDAPDTPAIVTSRRSDDCVSLEWRGVKAPDGHPAVRYNVYAALGGSVDTGNIRNLVAQTVTDTVFEWKCRTERPVAIAVTAVNAFGVESSPVCLQFPGKSSWLSETVNLPEPRGWGQRVEVLDIYGRRLYYGKYRRTLDIRGLQGGGYVVNVYDRHGARLFTRTVFK